MQTLEQLRQIHAFNQWANGLILDSCKDSDNPNPKAIELLGHNLLAEKLWLDRMQGILYATKISDFWNVSEIARLEELFADNKQRYDEFLANLTEETLETIFIYKNSEGREYQNNYRETLLHVFFHSTQHRGQIIQAIRTHGEEPPYIDFIGFLRQ